MGGSTDQTKEQSGASSKKKRKSKSKPVQKGDDADKGDKASEEHLKKAQLEAKIRERVASEAKAFDIVNRLIEPGITSEYMLEACQFLEQSHYEDIVEERSISHLCGYPVCNNTLGQVSKKKYQISTKSNTVYDITDRKRFCSNTCYHASKHLHKQIPDTPVWTRADEEKVHFDLLQHQTTETPDGEEVIGLKLFGIRDELLLLDKLDKKSHDASVSKKKSKTSNPVSVEESQRLSENLLSLSVDEDLESQMGGLSVSEKGEAVPLKDGLLCKVSDDTFMRSSLKQVVSVEDCGESIQDVNDQIGVRKGDADDNSEVESAMGQLTLQNSCVVDSDDDEEVQDFTVTGNRKSDIQNPYQDSISAKACADQPTPLEVNTDKTGVDSDSLEPSKIQRNTDLKQQPGESRSSYLMRLLDKRRDMLSKVADIQSSSTHSTQTPESKTKLKNIKDKSDVGHFVSKIKQNSDDESKHNQMQSETVQEQAQRADSEATHTSIKEKSTQEHTRAVSKSSTRAARASSKTTMSALESICQIISSWVTSETLTFLGLNSAKAKEGEAPSTDAFHKDPEIQKKYQDLCQRLAGQEKDFEDVLGEEEVEEEEKGGGRNPLPHFEELKKETEKFQLRVQKFLGGSSTATEKSEKREDENGKGENAENGRPISLPVVDSHNQMLIRKRIVLERLDRAMPGILPPLGLSVQDVSASLREMVFTFSFTSHNIVFKPVEWNLVAIVLLKMMENKLPAVKSAFRSESMADAFSIVLSRLGYSADSVGDLVHGTLMQRKQYLSESFD